MFVLKVQFTSFHSLSDFSLIATTRSSVDDIGGHNRHFFGRAIFQETKQPLGGNLSNQTGRRSHRGQRRAEKLGKPQIVETSHRDIFRRSYFMLVERLKNANCRVIITGKNSIERVPPIFVNEFIHCLISEIAFEFSMKK